MYEERNGTNSLGPEFYGDNAVKKKKKGKISSCFFTALIAALIGGMIGAYIFPVYLMGKVIPNPVNSENNVGQQVNEINIKTTNDIYYAAAVAEKCSRSVVGITVIATVNDIFWGEQQMQGMGSGVIVNSNGYILTNSHVIGDGNAQKITVLLADETQENGEVLWYDTTLDLAVVKIDRTGLIPAELGDSDELMIGEPVVAIGNPLSFELQRTVTNGIVSGLNRSLTVTQNNQHTVIGSLIQTNASINPGNSGGPLLNAEGKVIGINTAKLKSGEGLGFSIPINTAIPILEQLISGGEVSTVYVGIKGIDVEGYEERLNIDLTAEYGVVIVEVIKDSPSSKIDIKSGDVIQKIDDNKINSMNDLKRKLYDYKAGDKAEITIYRDGETITKEIIFEEKPDNY